MPAYAIVCYRAIKDPAKMREYGRLAFPTLKAANAIPRVANVAGIAVEGPDAPNVVVLEFKDMESAQAWYASPEYQMAREVRLEAADVDFLLVDGVSMRDAGL